MAINRFTGATNNNWNVSTNWSQGTVPTSVDGHTTTFDGTSPNCTLNTTGACMTIDFTGYTNTFAFGSNELDIYGSMTLSASMTITGTGPIYFVATGTLTSNGKTLANDLHFFQASATFTLGDNMTTTGNVLFQGTSCKLNGNTLYCGAGLNYSANCADGTTEVIMNGTGTLQANGLLGNNLTINTTGTITFSGNIYHPTKNLTYVAGTVITTGSNYEYGTGTLDCKGSNSPYATTISSSGINFDGLIVYSGGAKTILSDIWCKSFTSGANSYFTGSSYNIYVNGTWTNNTNGGGSGVISSLATINLIGTGTWANNDAYNYHPVIVNTNGTLTCTGNHAIGAGTTWTYIKGTIVQPTANYFRCYGNTTLNGWNKIFQAITFKVDAGSTITMDKFFNGTLTNRPTITAVSTTRWNLTFSTSIQQLGKFVSISYCTLTQQGSLLMTSIGWDRGNNTGILTANKMPNGFSSSSKLKTDMYGFVNSGLNGFTTTL